MRENTTILTTRLFIDSILSTNVLNEYISRIASLLIVLDNYIALYSRKIHRLVLLHAKSAPITLSSVVQQCINITAYSFFFLLYMKVK